VSPVRIHYRDAAPARRSCLHGGWGTAIYPFDRQIATLGHDHRIVIPDRTGYGQSAGFAAQEVDFHQRAAAETFGVIDALGLDRPVLWGHSDGAVISLLMASRIPIAAALIVEATHLYRSKPASRAFFETMMRDPDGLGERVAGVLAREHGASWRDVIRINGVAWRRMRTSDRRRTKICTADACPSCVWPALVIHGAKDPRTEPGELEALRASLPRARFAIIDEGGHSPHSERLTADDVTEVARRFCPRSRPRNLAQPGTRPT